MGDRVHLLRPGCVDYPRALRWQRATAGAVREGDGAEAVAVLQHPAVFTVGARGGREHLLRDPKELAVRGASVLDVDRGGDITFHGPGQLVAYPILHLRQRQIRPTDYVRRLEATVIDTLAAFDVHGERVNGRPGVWIAGAKIAAVGVRVRGGVSSHGLALNVSTDLTWFDAIVPCGLANAAVTSLARLLGSPPTVEEVEGVFAAAFEQVFDLELVEVGEAGLREAGLREAGWADARPRAAVAADGR